MRKGYCRFGFGAWNAELKIGEGKKAMATAEIVGRGVHKYAGPIDHAKMIMNVAFLLCTNGGNSDCQMIIGQCLEPLRRYLTEYATKGNMSSHDLTVNPSSSASCSTPWTARARCRSSCRRC